MIPNLSSKLQFIGRKMIEFLQRLRQRIHLPTRHLHYHEMSWPFMHFSLLCSDCHSFWLHSRLDKNLMLSMKILTLSTVNSHPAWDSLPTFHDCIIALSALSLTYGRTATDKIYFVTTMMAMANTMWYGILFSVSIRSKHLLEYT